MKYGTVSGALEDPHGNRLHSEIFADASPVRTVCLFLLFFFCITVITPLIAAFLSFCFSLLLACIFKMAEGVNHNLRACNGV